MEQDCNNSISISKNERFNHFLPLLKSTDYIFILMHFYKAVNIPFVYFEYGSL